MDTRQKAAVGVMAGAALVAVGSLLPWATITAPLIGQVSKNGTDGDGVFTLILAVLVGALGVALWNRPGRSLAVLAGLGSAVVGLVAVVDISDIETFAADSRFVHVSVGIGLWLVAIGAVCSFVAACYAWKRSARTVEPVGVVEMAAQEWKPPKPGEFS